MKIDIIEHKGVSIVKLPRNFYIGNIVDIEEVWDRIIAQMPKTVGFDCEGLEFIDSSAIGTLVKFFNKSVKKDINMYVFGLRKDLLKIFETTKIDRIMSVVSKEHFEELFLK
ncbi:MAG: STAS domain-containing protein [Spirochaetota bacterium]